MATSVILRCADGETPTTATEDYDEDQAAITLAESMIRPLFLSLLAINASLLAVGFASAAVIAYLPHPPAAPAFGAGAAVLTALAGLLEGIATLII